jgi:hypothetical protein
LNTFKASSLFKVIRADLISIENLNKGRSNDCWSARGPFIPGKVLGDTSGL